ncbi:MAG: hypothetical protein U9O87_08725, partial [Verrucomicrobiota bacterium]|nr:hypothetical protein [Verrucomicrobiota bacterium]
KYKAVAKLFTEDGSVVNGRLNIMKDGHVEKELLYNWRLLLNTQVNLGIEVFDGVVTFYKDGEVLSKYPESGHDIFMFAGTEFISSGENCDFEGLVSDIEALINNQCSYELSPGWNLVSNPLEHHLATEHLFTDLQGNSIKGRMIWYWDATKKVYYELDKKDIPETLKGIWIYSHSGGKTPVVSAEMPENSYSLKKGWNLIGSEKEIEPLDNSTIIGKIWGWDADKGEYFHIDSLDNLPEWQSENEGRGKLKPGHAYWIYYKE